MICVLELEKLSQSYLNGKNLQKITKLRQVLYISEKTLTQGVVCPCTGAVYMSHIFFSLTTCPIKAKFYVGAFFERGNINFAKNYFDNMTKMADMPLYDKNI